MPFRTFHSAPTESTPPKKFATPVLTISTTYNVLPCQAIPTTDVKPSMNSVHGPLVAVGSQVTSRAHGAIRQMRDVPATSGPCTLFMDGFTSVVGIAWHGKTLYVVEIVKTGVANFFGGVDSVGALWKVRNGTKTELVPVD